MLLSMTGYGKAEAPLSGRKLICEIRSLNSKSLDLSVRLAPSLRTRELELRAWVGPLLERGKVDMSIYFQEEPGASESVVVNWDVAKEYARQYGEQFGLPVPAEVMATIVRMPDVLKQQDDVVAMSDEDFGAVQATMSEAVEAFRAFRTQEGAALQDMFEQKLDDIEALLAEVEPFEKGRVAKIRERLELNLAQLSKESQAQIDSNRLEQEMIYYLEKLDITEEKVRLKNHIRYFRDCMQTEGKGVGKKLGFIAQEMGREINTLGSKANQSEMQILVVKMKDVLEQIKEQVLNVL